MNAADVLDRAAELIVERGWAQRGDLLEPKICAWLALHTAAYKDERGPWLLEAAESALCDVTGLTVVDAFEIFAWNDAPERTVEDVLLAMKQAAHDLREQA